MAREIAAEEIEGWVHDHEYLRSDESPHPIKTVCHFRPEVKEEPPNGHEGECSGGCCNKIPCDRCWGDSAVVNGKRVTSQEWCMEMDVCAGMIDWDKVYGHD